MVGAHPVGSRLQGLPLRGRQILEGCAQFGLRELERAHVLRRQRVKALRVVQHGGIAAGLDIGQDVGHTLLDGRIGIGRPLQTRLQGLIEVGLRA